MRAKWMAALGAAAMLGGCVTTESVATVSAVTLSQAQIATLKAGIASRLKDPDSARFGDVFRASSDGKGNISVCGTVNAKNSYGGYTGAQVFYGVFGVANPGQFTPIEFGSDEISTNVALQMCREAGISL